VPVHIRLGLTVMLLGSLAARLQAQAPQDSVLQRLEQAEEAIERLQNALAEQAQSKIQSRLQNPVEISGLILINGFYDGAKFNNADVPQWVAAAQDTSGVPNSRLGGLLRQTRIGITVRPGTVLGAQLSADLQLDFYGGEPEEAYDRLVTPPRIRTANVRLAWPQVSLLVGQEKPIISPQLPVSFAASGYPEFAGAGNLWAWIPQARLTYETGSRARVGIQGAVLDQIQETDAILAPSPQPDIGERSGRPSVEGRLYLTWGTADDANVIGVGAHRGWLATAGAGTIASEALTADLHIVMGVISLTAEAFNGKALGGLGDGGVGQDIGPQGRAVSTMGGWGQLNFRPSFAWELGGGYGRDDPDDGDLQAAGGATPAGARLRNVVYEGHVHWRPGGGLLLGVALRRFETTFAAGTKSASHVNVFAGVFF
jgi:hypothetical protein